MPPQPWPTAPPALTARRQQTARHMVRKVDVGGWRCQLAAMAAAPFKEGVGNSRLLHWPGGPFPCDLRLNLLAVVTLLALPIDASYPAPPVPAVVLDPDGRVTVVSARGQGSKPAACHACCCMAGPAELAQPSIRASNLPTASADCA